MSKEFKSTKIVFNLKAPPFSVNKMYYKKTFNRTREARQWATVIFTEMRKALAQQQLALFRKEFNPKTEGVKLSLTYYYPRDIILTKSGSISSRSFDLSNVEKPLQDLIFDKKYNAREYPEGCINLNLNDVTVCDLISKKRPSNDGCNIVVELESFSLEEWNDF